MHRNTSKIFQAFHWPSWSWSLKATEVGFLFNEHFKIIPWQRTNNYVSFFLLFTFSFLCWNKKCDSRTENFSSFETNLIVFFIQKNVSCFLFKLKPCLCLLLQIAFEFLLLLFYLKTYSLSIQHTFIQVTTEKFVGI